MKKPVKKHKKTRVSAKQRLLKIHNALELATTVQRDFQTLLFDTIGKKHPELLHESAMVGHFIYEMRVLIERALIR